MPNPVTPPAQQEPPEQWTQADVLDAHRLGLHEQIEQARQAGQLADLMAGDPNANSNVRSRRLGDLAKRDQ